ncbi:MAG: MGMT family protein [Gammaproteobacteria bacterium]|nr:MGMT family protein [Gammaproteobacteria bacterium]
MPSPRLTRFREAVLKRVQEIPSGMVVTYADLGDRKCANVGGAMTYLVDHEYAEIPWHRVVKKGGRLSDKGMSGQQDRLLAEGITFRPDGSVNLDLFEWKEHHWGPID